MESEMGQHSIGERFGDYTLVRPLGEGGFANVYLGQEVHKGTLAAIKLPKEQQVHDFINEVRRTFRLRHPHIIEILDFGLRTPDNTAFIIMEYAPNGSFREKFPRGTRVPLDAVVTAVKQVASALQYAHDQRVIHRDVKPENLLLNAQNSILLSDFGIATASRTSMTANAGQGDIIGTYAYMAPEQLKGRPVPASDQYSLGIMVYEWLCGELPFEAREYIHWHYLHEKIPPPALREHLPSLSPAVEQVVLKALAKKPEERFEQISQFALALERAARGDEPPVITTPRPTEHATQFDSSPDLAHTHSKSVEQLFHEGVQAQISGNAEEAFGIWRQIITTVGVPEQLRTTAHNRIQELRTQMIPLRLKQAREASMQGRWRDEIRLWEDLIVLEPTNEDLAPHLPLPLTLDDLTYHTSLIRALPANHSLEKRLQIARQNDQSAWMYKDAQRYNQNKDYATARKHLQWLWHDTPYYGDPAGLAQTMGLPPALNYEQAIAAEQAEQARLAEVKRGQERLAQLQQDKAKAKQKRNERMLKIIMGAVVIVGIAAGVGVGSAVGRGAAEEIIVGAAIGIAGAAIVAGIIIGVTEVKTVYGALVGVGAAVGGGVLVGGVLIGVGAGGGVGAGVEFSIAYGIIYGIAFGIVQGIASGRV